MPFTLFCALTFIIFGRPQDFISVLAPLRIALSMTTIVLIASLITNNFTIKSTIKSSQITKYYIFYLIMIFGIPFSIHRGMAFDFTILKYLSNILYFYFFIVYVDTIERFEKIISVICISVCFYAGFGLLNSTLSVARLSFGTMYDPNDLAFFLISLFPLAFYFINRKVSTLNKMLGILTIILSVTVSIMTGSRGGFIGLTLVVFILFFTRLSPLYRPQKILLLFMFMAAILFNISKIDTGRYQSIFHPEEDYNVTSEQGRLSVWKTGLKLTLEHPVTGVGVTCFPNAIGTYRLAIGVPPRWQAAHNSLIQILTETGIPGFLVFLSMIIGTLKVFFGLARNKSSSAAQLVPLELLGKVCLVGFTGLLATSFFLSMAYSNLFTLFFAFSVVLPNLAHEQTVLSPHHVGAPALQT